MKGFISDRASQPRLRATDLTLYTTPVSQRHAMSSNDEYSDENVEYYDDDDDMLDEDEDGECPCRLSSSGC